MLQWMIVFFVVVKITELQGRRVESFDSFEQVVFQGWGLELRVLGLG